MGDLIDFSEKKSIDDWKKFAETQFITIQFLQETNKKLEEEVNKLKLLVPTMGQSPVQKTIVSPEQALVDDQILMIQSRAYSKELNLEDIKKLDILLKHARILKEDAKIIDGKAKPLNISQSDLLRIAQGTSPKEGA
jgi:hypothetical protein